MTERYLFRGKRLDNGEWIIGSLVHERTSEQQNYYIEDAECHAGNRADKTTIGQCTGLRDKNGRLIFEGDVMCWTDSDGVQRTDSVSWMSGGLCLCNSGYTVGSYSDLEVVGNIHDGG